MVPIRRILHPTDLSAAADRALVQALDLALRTDAELHVLHVLVAQQGMATADRNAPAPDAPTQRGLERALRTAVADWLARHVPEEGGDSRFTYAVEHGREAAGAIAAYAAAHQVDLVVMGTHGRRSLRQAVLGSVASQVMRQAPCPVLIVRGTSPLGTVPVQRILVPTDFSPGSGEALQYAARMAALYGAQLDLLHVVEPFPLPVWITGIITLQDLVPDLKKQVLQRLAALLKREGIPEVTAKLHVTEGHAASTIVDLANLFGTDLIVLVPQGRTGVERFLLGSVSERVARRAPCPVLIFRSVQPPAEQIAALQSAMPQASIL